MNKYRLRDGERVLELFPEFNNYSEFRNMDDAMLRFVILCYDKDTYQKIPGSPTERKRHIISEILGMNDKDFQDVINGTNKAVNSAIHRFLIIQHDDQFSIYVSGKEGMHNMLKEVRTPVDEDLDDDKKIKAYENISKCFNSSIEMRKNLDIIEKEIFGKMEGDVSVDGLKDIVVKRGAEGYMAKAKKNNAGS